MVKYLSGIQVRSVVNQLKKAGFKVEGKKGWYKSFDDSGDKVFSAMPHSKGGSLCTFNAMYFGGDSND